MRTALKKLNIELKIEVFPSSRSIIMANNGETDGELFRIKGIEKIYPNLIPINAACSSLPLSFYVKSGKEFPVRGWESIPSNYILGHRHGILFIENNAQKYGVKTHAVNRVEQMIKLLDIGRVDVIIGNSILMEKALRSLNINGVEMLEPAVHTLHLYPYLHKKNRHLVPKLTAIFKEMELSGEIKNIQKRIFTEIRDQLTSINKQTEKN